MLVQSLINIIEASIINPSEKRLAGNIENFDELMTYENLVKLEQFHEGVFAFIAFHPTADKRVADYIELGSIGADAGKYVFALFMLNIAVHKPTSIGINTFKNQLTIDEGDHPAYKVVRSLFPRNAPSLPGILFIEKFSQPTEPVYVSLSVQKDTNDVLQFCRKLFEIAASSYVETKNENQRNFPLQLSTKLAKDRLNYLRGEQASMREWLIKAFNQIRQHSGDIVSVIKLFK